jgi:4-alpha-glucanotransferase
MTGATKKDPPGTIRTRYVDSSGKPRRPPASAIAALRERIGPPTKLPADLRESDTVAYFPDPFPNAGSWGVALQLYALRSSRNWGIGDFTDLAAVMAWADDVGAAFVGLNPLHALFTARPGRRSPYYPSSRLHLNPLYIDPDAAADLMEVARPARPAMDGGALIDYEVVATAKLAALRSVFDESEGRSGHPLAARFDAFIEDGGTSLYRHALFEALDHHFAGAGDEAWPEGHEAPETSAVEAFAETHADEIRFHLWLQWLSDHQLREAQAASDCVLYLDIAVGAAPDGSEVWSSPRNYVAGARLGAPPDLLARSGQDWGIAALSPATLVGERFAPFDAILEATMRHAGIVRVDHILAFDRQFLIPEGHEAPDGTYVSFPRDALLGRAAAISQRTACTIVGEALGTVPEGLVDAMHARGLLSYDVVRWSWDEDGSPRAPSDYPHRSLAVLGTHDTPTFLGWLTGADIEFRSQAENLTERDETEARAEREAEIEALCEAWGCEPDAEPDAILEAAHKFLARTRAALVAVNLEDLLAQREPVNVPGTVDEAPNWRRRYAVPLEEWTQDSDVRARLAAIAEVRP